MEDEMVKIAKSIIEKRREDSEGRVGWKTPAFAVPATATGGLTVFVAHGLGRNHDPAADMRRRVAWRNQQRGQGRVKRAAAYVRSPSALKNKAIGNIRTTGIGFKVFGESLGHYRALSKYRRNVKRKLPGDKEALSMIDDAARAHFFRYYDDPEYRINFLESIKQGREARSASPGAKPGQKALPGPLNVSNRQVFDITPRQSLVSRAAKWVRRAR